MKLMRSKKYTSFIWIKKKQILIPKNSSKLIMTHLAKFDSIIYGYRSSPIPADKHEIKIKVMNPINGIYKSGACSSSFGDKNP